ncbi:MAG: Holliday junction branch migration protein RuvA [Verrucomicrobiaceae bacterium]|nr:MAG: Holliday junction branch migration protein RuvA [Verrucomicrobiaceae bacterium]
MITFLRGRLAESLPDRVTVEVQGIGYEVFIPVSTYDRLPAEGEEVRLLTHHHVREQEQTLFGFATGEERDLFRLLINRVTGVGPKMGLAVLAGMAVRDFKRHVVQGDVAALSKISGVGKKTAERIILELKDKVGVTDAWKDSADGPGAKNALTPEQAAMNDAILGLINLGYKQVEAQKAVKKLVEEGTLAESGALVRGALRLLSQA